MLTSITGCGTFSRHFRKPAAKTSLRSGFAVILREQCTDTACGCKACPQQGDKLSFTCCGSCRSPLTPILSVEACAFVLPALASSGELSSDKVEKPALEVKTSEDV